jgi:hypothetical protein
MKNLFFTSVITLCISVFLSCGNKNTRADATKPDVGMITPQPANERVAAQWQGSYSGITPCADCPGIELTLTLKNDQTYEMTRVYKEREGIFKNSGAFTWNDAGTQINLQNVNEHGAFEHFIVQNGKLIMLTPTGELPEDVDMNRFTLSKKAF